MEKTCPKCGSDFTGDKRRRYCSRACQPSKPKTSVMKNCQGCGKVFEVSAYHAETRKFCDMTCYHKTRWGGERSSGQTCEHCGVGFQSFDCEPRRFCSHPCYVASGVGAKSGAASPLWKGGTSKHYRRGANWKERAAHARTRDGYACKGCGKHETELTGPRRRLDVHHIIPWSVSQSNELCNLVTLCRSCHHRSEPRPEVVAWLAACPTHQKSFLEQARAAWTLR